MKRSVFLFTLILLAGQGGAQETPDSLLQFYDLSEFVVTATRTPKLLKDAPIQTRVITRKDIERTDASDIQDLLTQVIPGVEFSYAMNQQTHLNFSGFGGQGLLFLVDGERLAGETMDDVDFSRISMADVERIEIVKGASSALYGSSAAGGVINIITKKQTEPWTVTAQARVAKHNEQRYDASFGVAGKKWSNSLSVGFNSRDNYEVHNEPNPVTRVISTIYGDKVYQAKDKLTWRPTDYVDLSARAGYYFRQTVRSKETPERYRGFSGGARLSWRPTTQDDLTLTYAFDQYDKSDHLILKGLEVRDYSNVQNSLRMLYNHRFGEQHTLTVGGDYMHDYLMNVNLDGKIREQDCMDLYAQYDWQLSSQWEFVGALRYDYLTEGHLSHLTPRLNVRYAPLRNLNLLVGYGMGFRAPSLKERYYNFDMSGIWIVEGNPDLQPELSHNLTASVEYTKKNINLCASVYYNKVRDKIATAAPYYKAASDVLPYVPYTNLADYRVYGGELGVNGRWDCGFTARVLYAYTHEELPTDDTGNTLSNQYLPARAHALNVCVEYDRQWKRRYGTSFCLGGRVLSGTKNQEYVDYYDISKGTVEVRYPAYTIWKLSTVHRIGRMVKLTLALDNVFNYRPRHYYLNAPLTDGINLQIGLKIDLGKSL